MPIFNPNINYLKECINSILNQTYKNWELVIIIDKNEKIKDSKVLKTLSKYKKTYKINYIINNKRIGISASLNKGILNSNGNLIARMDCDDICEPERLELQIKELVNNDIDFVGSWSTVIDENGKKLGELRPPCKPRLIRKNLMFHTPFIHPTMMFKKNVLLSVGLYDLRAGHSQDLELYMRLIHKGYLGVNIPKPLLNLRENTNSITRGRTWIFSRLDYIKVKVIGITKYNFHKPLDLLFMIASFSTLLLPPPLVNRIKKISRIFFS